MASKQKSVYLLEDDAYLVAALRDELVDLGCRVEIVRDASSLLAKKGRQPDCVICDLFVSAGSLRLRNTARYPGHGVEALRRGKSKWRNSSFILITGMPSLDAQQWCAENGVTYLVKPVTRAALERILGLRRLRAFVVHGRNAADRKKAEVALERGGIEPIVLMKQPNQGRTVIEKFERVADSCDVAVIVWSTDDFGGLTVSKLQRRARQNVVFETGYFYGALRRRSGRVALIEFGESDIPSDLAGVVRIDGRQSPAKIADELRSEFDHLIR